MNFENIDPIQFEELMKEGDSVVLDVRSPQELSEGSISGHQMINLFDPDFQTQIQKLDQSKTYLIYCRSGNRSGQACSLMASMGFSSLYNLRGGIMAWNAATVA